MKVGQDEAHSSDEQEDVEADLFTFVEEENRWEFLGTGLVSCSYQQVCSLRFYPRCLVIAPNLLPSPYLGRYINVFVAQEYAGYCLCVHDGHDSKPLVCSVIMPDALFEKGTNSAPLPYAYLH